MTVELEIMDLVKIAFGAQVVINGLVIMIIWLLRTDVVRAEKLVEELRDRLHEVEMNQLRQDFYK